MKVNKKIAFLVTRQHFVHTGGIGIFTKTFCELSERMGNYVHIISDLNVRDNDLFYHLKDQCKFFHPDPQIEYTTLRNSFAFNETVNYERVINYRNAFLEACHDNIYDLVIVNDLEGLIAMHSTGMAKVVPVMFYTHNENSVFFKGVNKVFTPEYTEMLEKMLSANDVVIGTQSVENQQRINNNIKTKVYVASMPVPERRLLQGPSDYLSKDGLIFIGRYEVRKNPEEFVRVVKEVGCKALVLTNKTSVKSWESAFSKADITNYEIQHGLIGDEKVDFILKAKAAYHPSHIEVSPFGVLEACHSCPTFIPKESEWSENLQQYAKVVSFSDAVAEIKKVMEMDSVEPLVTETLQKLRDFDDRLEDDWNKVFEHYGPRKASTSLNQFMETNEWTIIGDFYTKHLKRKNVSYEDVASAHKTSKNYIVLNDLDRSIVSKSTEVDIKTVESNDASLEDWF